MTDKNNGHDEGQSSLRESVANVATIASDAVDTSREKARELAHQTAHVAEANPLGIVAGGIALGALVGTLLPRSQKEKELLAPVGKRLAATAVAAVAAARESGKSEFQNLGLTKGGAKDQVKTLLQNVAGAATTAGKAAASAGKNELKHSADAPNTPSNAA